MQMRNFFYITILTVCLTACQFAPEFENPVVDQPETVAGELGFWASGGATRVGEGANCLGFSLSDELGSDALSDQSVGFAGFGNWGATRTAAASDGVSMIWQADDRVALWAAHNGSYVLQNQTFTLHYNGIDGADAFFTSTTASMPQGTYTYYALSPEPASVSGTAVGYTVAAVQSSDSVWQNDILQSSPTSASELGTIDQSDLNVTMLHRLHAFRFFMEEGDNSLGGSVGRIEIAFPANVVGDVSFDLTDPSSQLTLTNGGSAIEVIIPDGLNVSTESSTDYAYALFLPVNCVGEQIEFKVYSANRYGTMVRSGRDFRAGHITPVRLSFDQTVTMTVLRFSLGTNNLGETPQKVTIATTDGSSLTSSDSSVTFNTADTFYSVGYGDVDVTDVAGLTGKSLIVTYESESAIVSKTITLPTVTAQAVNSVVIDVPWLFEEDFASVADFHSNDTYKTSDSSNPSAIALIDYGLQSGWTGARIGGYAGLCVRLCGRFESGLWANAKYPGRMDSAPLSTVKSGKSIKVNVQFGCGGEVYGGVSASDDNPTLEFGTTTDQSALKGNADITNSIDTQTIARNGSSTAAPTLLTYDIEGCGSTTRLSWRVSTDRGGSFAANDNYYVYIDNIKVKIVK